MKSMSKNFLILDENLFAPLQPLVSHQNSNPMKHEFSYHFAAFSLPSNIHTHTHTFIFIFLDYLMRMNM